jgi:HK97 family phage prohead protease
MTLRFYGDIQRVNTEERIVSGYAATTQEASDGLTIVRDAYASALTEYMRFANIREMHRPSAVGVAREAEVDDTGLWIDAFIQDADAWDKVKTGVYKAFSIGAKITERDAEDETLIRGIRIVEISLVDRPADPGAVIEVFRAEDADEARLDLAATAEEVERREFSADERKKLAKSGAAMKDGSFPIANKQDLKNAIEAYGRAKNKAAAKRHIKARAKALGAEDMIPDSWKSAARAETLEDNVDKDLIERAGEPVAETPAVEAEIDTRVAPADAAPAETVIEHAETVADEASGEAVVEATEEVERTEEAPAEAEAVEAPLDPVDRATKALEALSKAVDRAAGVEEKPVVVGAEEFAAATDALDRFAALESAVLSDEQNEKLNGLIETLVARGLKLKATEAAAAGVEEVALERAALVEERDTLKRRFDEFADSMTTLVERVQALESRPAPAPEAVAEAVAEAVEPLVERMKAIEETPLPPKTVVTAAVAVSKEQDASGIAERAPGLSGDDLKRALDAMSDEERTLLLIRAAQQRPFPIK